MKSGKKRTRAIIDFNKFQMYKIKIMLSYEFLVGRLSKIVDLEESGLNADLQIAKQ